MADFDSGREGGSRVREEERPVQSHMRPDLRADEVIQGARPGDRHVRHRADPGPFKRVGSGLLSASLETDAPRTAWGRRLQKVFPAQWDPKLGIHVT